MLDNPVLSLCIMQILFCALMMHIHVSKERGIVGFDDGLTNTYRKQCCLVVNRALGKYFSDILIKFQQILSNKMHVK